MRIAATFSSCSLDRPMSRRAPSPANQTRSKASHDARAAFFRSLTTFRSRGFDAVVRGSDLVARRQDAREEDARGGQGPKLGDAALERDEIVRQTDDRFLELLHLVGRARDRRRDLLDLLPVPGGEGRPPALSKATRSCHRRRREPPRSRIDWNERQPGPAGHRPRHRAARAACGWPPSRPAASGRRLSTVPTIGSPRRISDRPAGFPPSSWRTPGSTWPPRSRATTRSRRSNGTRGETLYSMEGMR